MNLVSKFAIALLAAALTAAPAAYAQYGGGDAPVKKSKKEKKGKEAAAPKRNYSKEFMAAYTVSADALNKKKDVAAAKAAFPGVVASVQNDDDRYEAGVLGINIGAQLKDTAFQEQGIDLLLASATTPPNLKTEYGFRKGAFAYDAKNFAAAEKNMIDAYNSGYRANNIEFLISNALSQQSKDAEAGTWLIKAIEASKATGQPQKPYILRAAVLAGKAKDYKGAANWYKELLLTENNPDYWHDALIFFDRSLTLDPEETLDLMRLMRSTGGIRFQQEYVQYLDSLSYIGVRYPAEAVSLLDEGFAKGVISRSNVTFSETYTEAKARLGNDTATLAGTLAPAKAPNAKPILASLTADSFFSHKDYKTAAELYAAALSKGAVIDKGGRDQTDRTRFRLAMSKVYSNDYAGAKADFALLTSPNRKAMAEYWNIYIDQKTAAPAVQPTAA